MSISKKFSAAVILACALTWASGAAAQATRTWVSGVGDDANPCSRTAPCLTFDGAISKTAAGGEVDVLDPGDFGLATINKSLTIGTDPALGATVRVSGVYIDAGPTGVVVLRGLTIQGAGTGTYGVRFAGGKSLTILNCNISGYRFASPAGIGVEYRPADGVASTLTIVNTKIANNGDGTGGGGILIHPLAPASVKALLNNVTVTGNTVGLRADAYYTDGVVRVSVFNSTFSGNVNGGVAALSQSGYGYASVSLQNVTSSNNGQGLNANGGNTTIRFGYSTIVGNTLGVQQFDGGVAQSYGNNIIGNVSGNDGTWTALPLR